MSAKRKTAESDHDPILESDHDPILEYGPIAMMPIEDIEPSPENDDIYRPVDRDDRDFRELVADVRQNGIREPLIVSLDDFILSGHRRYAAAQEACLSDVPVRFASIRRSDDLDEFVKQLVAHNKQRVKSNDELLREAVLSTNPHAAYRALVKHRKVRTAVGTRGVLDVGAGRARAKISKAKWPFLEAVQAVIEERYDFWPLSVRQIHYYMLSNPPLIHASKPSSTYANSAACYKALIDLLVRARYEGLIDFDAISDSTRPVTTWNVHRHVGTFIRRELDNLFKHYWRDLQQSQPCHLEICGEKSTLDGIIRPVAAEFCVPYTLGRGYCSAPPRRALVERFRQSGKDRLVLLFITDFDPEGMNIPVAFAQSLVRDEGIDPDRITTIKVALTHEQVTEFELPPNTFAKQSSSRYAAFAAQYGAYAWELEALEPEALQRLLREQLDVVLNINAFNTELDLERQDSVFLAGVQRRVHDVLSGIDFGDADDGDDVDVDNDLDVDDLDDDADDGDDLDGDDDGQ